MTTRFKSWHGRMTWILLDGTEPPQRGDQFYSATSSKWVPLGRTYPDEPRVRDCFKGVMPPVRRRYDHLVGTLSAGAEPQQRMTTVITVDYDDSDPVARVLCKVLSLLERALKRA